jgi:hypothetical protein
MKINENNDNPTSTVLSGRDKFTLLSVSTVLGLIHRSVKEKKTITHEDMEALESSMYLLVHILRESK